MDAKKNAALLAIIKLVADAAKDTAQAIKPGQSALARLVDYKNLVEDVTALIPQIGDVGAEIKALTAQDGVELVAALVADLTISDTKAQAIVAASLDLLQELAGPVLTKVEVLVGACKA